jgi:hypothetical protein
MMNKTDNCFSEDNFDSLYKFIVEKISAAKTTYYLHSGYEIHVGGPAELRFKKDHYTLAVIHRKKGIFSLAIKQADNDKIMKEVNRLFCELIEQPGCT